MTKGGKKINRVGMYDFRHSSSCYWIPRYKSESALKYRFGWKKDSMIHHYSKLLGMRDTIEEQDLTLNSEVKTKLERELEAERNKRNMIEEQVEAMGKLIKEKNKKDDFVFKFIKGLVEKGKLNDAVELVHEEKIEKELAKLTE